jgi:mediator of RNA polymerase II transcription subunit 6
MNINSFTDNETLLPRARHSLDESEPASIGHSGYFYQPIMASQDPPLDEIQWRSPGIAMGMQGIHSNSVLFYFAESPFFDKTSNNAVLFSQAVYNPNMFPIIQTREAFEGRLKTMSGLEYIVAQEPADMVNGTGVWVIRKQTRRKRQPEEDEITLHSTYFVVGENIYMAPAVADVLRAQTVGSTKTFMYTDTDKM